MLGVKVATMCIDGRVVALDHPELADGWYEVEVDGRWTNGAAVIPASIFILTRAETMLYRPGAYAA